MLDEMDEMGHQQSVVLCDASSRVSDDDDADADDGDDGAIGNELVMVVADVGCGGRGGGGVATVAAAAIIVGRRRVTIIMGRCCCVCNDGNSSRCGIWVS